MTRPCIVLLLAAMLVALAGCATDASTTAPSSAGQATTEPTSHHPVRLSPSSISWDTEAYELTKFETILSHDPATIVTHEFDTWVLENEFLRVTLLPEFGGRIISLVYLPTGHEQLYRNPLGVPYQIDTGVFFFNWLMVYGGVFPTFPGPEHGKTWFHPWEFRVVEETTERVTVAMSYTDLGEYPLAPGQYDGAATGLKVTWFITLESGRAALDTAVRIENPGQEDVSFEYWTNATFAPGSDPGDPRATAGAEIVAPMQFTKIPPYWSVIAELEERTGVADVHEFDALRSFVNWDDMGIAYAWPDMRHRTFWGVINRDNDEGVLRIADNTITPGLKLWTWGYDRAQREDPREARSYIEMWAGLSREFFVPTSIGAREVIEFDEVYSPIVGLSDVSAADATLVTHARIDGDDAVIELFSLNPGDELTLTLLSSGVVLDAETVTTSPLGDEVRLTTDGAGAPLEVLIQGPNGSTTILLESHP